MRRRHLDGLFDRDLELDDLDDVDDVDRNFEAGMYDDEYDPSYPSEMERHWHPESAW